MKEGRGNTGAGIKTEERNRGELQRIPKGGWEKKEVRAKQKRRGKKSYSTGFFQAVSHPSTNPALAA